MPKILLLIGKAGDVFSLHLMLERGLQPDDSAIWGTQWAAV